MEIREVLALVLLYGDCASEATRAKALKLVPGLEELVTTAPVTVTQQARAYRLTASVDGIDLDHQDVVSRETDLAEHKRVFRNRFDLAANIEVSSEPLL